MGTLATALLDDARHRPEDDTPRLILADWLQEHGDELRGRFLRSQCLAAAWPDEHPDRIDLERDTLDLLLEHEPRWLGTLTEGAHAWTFARGLLWLETTFHSLVDSLGIATPDDLAWVEGISLIGKDGWDRLRPDHPLLPGLAGLDLSGSLLGGERLAALLGSFPAGQLRHLDLSFNELDDDGLQAILHLPALAGLTQLELRHNHLTHGALRRLRNAPCWEHLRSLNLRENQIGLEGVIELSRDAPAGLTALGLGSAKIRSVHGLAQLLAAPLFPRLTQLDLGHTALGASGMEELARYKGATRLRWLNLEVNRLDDSALAHLARAQVLAGVEALSLADNPVSDTGARLLADSRYLGRLAWLSLDHSPLEARGLLALLRSPWLASLSRLDVSRALSRVRSELDDLTRDEVRVPLTTLNLAGVRLSAWSLRGVYALLESLSLRKLDLARNGLGPASCPWLTDCPGLRNLVHLGLAGNNLYGLEALTRSQVLRGLRSLDLGGVPLGDLEGDALANCEAWGPRLRLIASPLGLSRPALEQLHARYGRLDEHGLNVPRWFEAGAEGSRCPIDPK
jgi:uncharacterized protein (TIGR02996 family)